MNHSSTIAVHVTTIFCLACQPKLHLPAALAAVLPSYSTRHCDSLLDTPPPLVHSQVGLHPDTNEPILANSGRFGPYLKHKTLTVTLPKGCGPLDVTTDQALAAVAAKETRMRARGRDPYEVRTASVGGCNVVVPCHWLVYADL
jgi:hypothetical protein